MRHQYFAVLFSCAATMAACTPSEDRLLAQAQSSIVEGEVRTAEIHLKNLLQLNADHVEARLLLGKVLVDAGDPVGAAINLRRALELGAAPAAVQLPLLRALLDQGDFAGVLEQIRTGPTLDGEDEIARRNIEGAAHRALRAFAAAETAYQAALALDPQSPITRIELANLYFDSGRLDEARPIAAEVYAAQPDYAPALVLLGRVDAVEGRVVDAERWFTEASRLSMVKGLAAVYVTVMTQLIEAQLPQRKFDEADANIEMLLRMDAANSTVNYLKARVEIERGDLESAEQRLEGVVAAEPKYWPAYGLLGRINIAQDQLGQAVLYLRTAAGNNPSDVAARLLLAEIYVRQDNMSAARDLFQSSRSLTVPEGLVMALAGRTSLQAGRSDLAAEFFDRSERTPPGGLRELLEVSSIYVAAGELDRAVRVLESSSFDLPESDQLVTYVLTLVQLRRGDTAAAAATAAKLASQREPVAWLSTLRGSIATLANDLSQAQAFFDEALALEPEHVPALLGLARVAALRGSNAEAAEHLRRVIEIEPQQLNAILGLAELAIARGDLAEAGTWLASTPESAARFRLEGDLELNRRAYAAAAAAYRRSFALAQSADMAAKIYEAAKLAGEEDPSAALAQYAERNPADPGANFALGSIALEAGDQATAVTRYEAVLAADPNNAAALNNLAWIYSERGDERAFDLAVRAREMLPTDPSVADTLGWLLVQRGNAADGLPLLDEAVRSHPEHPEVRYHWAVALAATGDGSRAEAVLDSLLASVQDFPSRAAAERRLSQLRAQSSR